MTIAIQKLSGSTDGAPIKVTGTNTGGAVTIHTADATALDTIHLFVDNDDTTSDITLTLEIGGATDPDNTLKITVPKRGTQGDGRLFIAEQLLTNSKTIKAFASAANKLKITGKVVRQS